MFSFSKTILPVLLATAWISVSEFFRNQFLLSGEWTAHYAQLGLVFPAKPINGAIWGIWSLVFASLILVIGKKFSLVETIIIAWVAGFVMMWLVIGNLDVLPVGIFGWAIPLSILESVGAAWIVKRFNPEKNKSNEYV